MSERATLDAKEARWLERQRVKAMKDVYGRSKYVPHIGKKERARRLRQAQR